MVAIERGDASGGMPSELKPRSAENTFIEKAVSVMPMVTGAALR